MRVRQTNGLRLSTEFIDKVNPTKNRYKERPIFDLLDFFPTKDAGYVYLTVVTIGDRNGAPILVYQIGGPTVILEKITDYLYRYPDPEDEVYTERLFEVEVIIDNIESKKKQAKVISDPSVYYLTSQIYPINLTETASTSSKGITGRILTTNDLRLYQSIFEESYTSLSRITGVFKQSLFQYAYKNTDNNPYEPVKINLNKVTGILRQLLQTYSTVPENAKVGFSRVTGTMRQLLIQYNFYTPETLKTGVNRLDGSTATFTPYHEIFINGNTVDYNPNDSDNGVTIIERTVSAVSSTSVNDNGVAYKTYNTSALDFENGLVDRLNSGVIWNKSGTGDLVGLNKLYSSASFETKALGDSLYTNSNIITGSSTPFTIEFTVLVAPVKLQPLSDYYPLFTDNVLPSGGQGLFIHKDTKYLMYQRTSTIETGFGNKTFFNRKIQVNEINKLLISYDGAALRFFLNGVLDYTIGTTVGHYVKNTFNFLRNITTEDNVTKGILDNIVISDGIATQVRNKDENEGSLIIDLTFDGENNSTVVKDNGSLGLVWSAVGNAKLSTTQSFDGYSSLSLDGNGDYIQTNNVDLNFGTNDFTISFSSMILSYTNQYQMVISNSVSNKSYIVFWGDYSASPSLARRITIGIASGVALTSSQTYNLNVEYKIDVVRKDKVFLLFINDKLDSTLQVDNAFNLTEDSNSIAIGYRLVTGVNDNYFNGYIKNFKVYKGVAIKPKNTEYKIRLDFENNVLDTYKNSTWTSSGITYNNVNSIKGYSAYFTGTSHNLISDNQYINLNNFSIQMDVCFESSASYKVLFHAVNSLFLYYNTSSNQFMIETYNSGSYIGGWSTRVIKLEFLKFYNVRLVVKYSKAYIFVNNQIHDILTLTMPTATGVTTTFRIGRPPSNTSYFFNGYIDNVEIIPNLLRYEGVWVQTVSAINGYGLSYNPNDLTQPTYTEMYNNTKGFAVLQHKTQASPNVSVTLPAPVTINKSVVGKSFYMVGGNGTWSDTDISAQLELLDNNGQVVLALKWAKDGTYRHGMWYGPNLTNLTKADQKGSYPQTNGNMYFYNDRVVWVHNDAAVNANLSFTYVVNLSNVTSLRVSGLSSLFDYTSGFCYFAMIENKENKVIELNRPTLHLPLETNSINTGTSELTISEVGSPTYQTFAGKKCIKFELGKYLNITSNPIFKLDYYTDFYIEMDFYYIPNGSSVVPLISSSSGQPFVDICINPTGFVYIYRETSAGGGITSFAATTACIPNAWNKIIFKRKVDITSFVVNDNESQTTKWFDIDLSLGSTHIGNTRAVWGIGYMSDFKMFVGTSQPSINYNSKAVLDLDFSPTRNSYLFKDNLGKSVLNPINVTERDYQNSEYCCTFDGTDRRIALGKNSLLNFGADDYVLYIRFKVTDFTVVHQRLMSDNYSTGSAFSYIMITGDSYSNASLTRRLFIGYDDTNSAYSYSTSQLEANTIYDAVFVRSGNTTNTYINGKLEATFTSALPFNLNYQDNTYIGGTNPAVPSQSTQLLKGSIYKIKAYRNTEDTSVLNLPILNTPSNVYLPLVKDSVDIRTGTTWTNTAAVTYSANGAYIDPNTNPTIRTVVENNLNYGTGDFTVGIESYKNQNYGEARLVASLASATSTPRTEIKQSATLGLTLSNYLSSSETMYKTGKSGDLLNNWYKSKFSKTNNTLFTYINDSLIDITTINNGVNFNLNANSGTILGGIGWSTNATYKFGGYLKNFYSNSTANVDNVLPYLYMPYDTTLTDLGVNTLSITNGTTSASVLDTLNGVKCTKITTVSTNPYITMTLGSVFSIKARINIPVAASSGYGKPILGTGWASNTGFLLSQFTEPWSGSANPELWLRTPNNNVRFAINSLIGTWIDIIITKTLTTMTLNVNGVDVGSLDSSMWNAVDFESTRAFYIGDGGSDWKESSTFYIKDFRFYKGLSSIPTNEVLSRKILDLKFKKDDARAYPFKDESRRHIVSYNAMNKYNLVNIEGVDCVQFNGVDQYLELGNTKLMNFGNEDFVIAFKVYVIPYVHTGASQWQIILASGGTSSSSNVSYIAYDQTTKSLVIRATDNEVYRISNVLNEYAWNTVIITRTGDKFNTTINNNINLGVISSTANFNLNYNANTYMGINKWNTSNEYLKGYLADLQIVKGSSDTSLIDVNTTETITIVNPPKSIYYPIKLNEVDSFSNSWYQTNATNPVRLKEYNKGVNTSMYFDGISGLQSNNTFNRIGLSPFTVECSILIDSPINSTYHMSIFSYGKDYNRPEWFNLEVTSTGVLRFQTNRSPTEYVSSPVGTINYNTKYDIAVTRDTDYNLRIFVNGIIVANQVVTNCFDSYSQNSGGSYSTSSNWLFIGKQGAYWNTTNTTQGGFKGNIENFHYLVGTCKYTSNYTPSIDETIKLETMSLINADVTMGTNPSTIPDTRNNIVYTNSGCTIEALTGQLRPYSIRCQTTSNRLISPVNESMFNLGTLNWTIDLTFRPMQTSAEAYLLDTRANSTIFRGLVIRQPQTNPTTLMIEVGSSNAASAFENTYQTAANSLVVNTTYHLRLVRCRDVILVFMNGTLLTTINYGVKDIGYSNKIILFNNDLFSKGFNGYITQFRFIKGISTDVFAFPQITQELK